MADYNEMLRKAGIGKEISNDSFFGALLNGNIVSWLEKQISGNTYLSNLVNGMTGAGLTDRDKQLNELNRQNVEDQASLQRAGYEKAGFNPALMYGQMQTAPTAQSSSVDGSIIDKLLSVIFAKQQFKNLEAQNRNIEADTSKKQAETGKIQTETDFQKLVNAYYPQLTEAQIAQIYKTMEVQSADIDLKAAQAAFQRVQTAIAEIDKTFKSAHWNALIDNLNASSEAARAKASADIARAAVDSLEAAYMERYNMHMGSNDYVALATALSNMLEGKANDTAIGSVVHDIGYYLTHPFKSPLIDKLGPKVQRKIKEMRFARVRGRGAYGSGSGGGSR